jgi:hypothetical protein
MSDGNSLWKDKKESVGQQAALSSLRIAREQPGDQTMTDHAPAGATPAGHTWSWRLLLSAFACHADQYRVRELEISVRSPGTMLRELES